MIHTATQIAAILDNHQRREDWRVDPSPHPDTVPTANPEHLRWSECSCGNWKGPERRIAPSPAAGNEWTERVRELRADHHQHLAAEILGHPSEWPAPAVLLVGAELDVRLPDRERAIITEQLLITAHDWAAARARSPQSTDPLGQVLDLVAAGVRASFATYTQQTPATGENGTAT